MSGDPVLCIDNSRPPRIGRLVEDEGRQIVLWSDGSRTVFSIKNVNVRKVREGTLQAEYAADPEGFLAILKSDPSEIYALALRSIGRAQPGRLLKLTELEALVNPFVPDGLDPAELKKKASPKLRKHKNIEYRSDKREYCWREAPADPLADIDTYPLAKALLELRSTSRDKGSQPKRDRLLSRIGHFDLANASAADKMAAWSQGLVESLPTADPAVLWGLDENTLAKYIQARGDTLERDEVSAVLGVGRTSKSADNVVHGLDPAAASDVLLVCLAQRHAAGSGSNGLSAFLERVAQQLPGELNGKATAALLSHVLLAGEDPPQQVLDALGAALSRRRVSQEVLTEALRGVHRTRILRAVRGLPWDAVGLRARLYEGAIRAGEPGELESLDHWQPLTVDDLAVLVSGRSPIAAFLLTDGNRRSPAARIIDRWLQDGWSRKRLATVLQWPNQMLALLPEGSIAVGAAAVADNSPAMKRLLTDPRTNQQLEDSARAVRAAEEALSAAQDVALQAQREAQRSAEDAHHERELRLAAEDLLRRARRESTRVLDSQLRQAQIDAVQALARVLDDLAGYAVGSPEGDRLLQRALLAARAVHLEPIGATGDVADFAPAIHERADGSASARIIVGRPGYVWYDGSDQTVLRKALVTGCE